MVVLVAARGNPLVQLVGVVACDKRRRRTGSELCSSKKKGREELADVDGHVSVGGRPDPVSGNGRSTNSTPGAHGDAALPCDVELAELAPGHALEAEPGSAAAGHARGAELAGWSRGRRTGKGDGPEAVGARWRSASSVNVGCYEKSGAGGQRQAAAGQTYGTAAGGGSEVAREEFRRSIAEVFAQLLRLGERVRASRRHPSGLPRGLLGSLAIAWLRRNGRFGRSRRSRLTASLSWCGYLPTLGNPT